MHRPSVRSLLRPLPLPLSLLALPVQRQFLLPGAWRWSCWPQRLGLLGLAGVALMAVLSGPARAEAPMQTQTQEPTDPADAAFFDRVATCAAAMKSAVLVLRDRHQSGDASVRPEIVRLTELTFAMVGRAYLRGLRGEPADRLLDAAEAIQRDWPEARRKGLAAQCQVEAAAIYREANFLEQLLVRNRAAKRVERLLDPKP